MVYIPAKLVIIMCDFMTLDEFLDLFDGTPLFVMLMHAKEQMLLDDLMSFYNPNNFRFE
jgi:hypothetical protein